MKRMQYMLLLAVVSMNAVASDSLPPLKDGKPAQSVKELWAEYDSTKEPLEAKVIQEWKVDGVTIRYMTYTIGTFKGKKSTMAAYYAFPTDVKGKIPALVQMHGGGQRASVDSAKYGAQNGYACISVNWGGRELETAKPGDPKTDWGALDATQTGHNSHFGTIKPDDRTVDSVESPRNSNWYLITLAVKRAITFLQEQPYVDDDEIGAFGHSMGGKLTAMITGADKRIKAAVPSCGGSGMPSPGVLSRPNSGEKAGKSELSRKTINDAKYIELVKVPILYQAPHNDFAGKLDNMYESWKVLGSKARFTITPHMNHRHIPEHGFANILFFDAHLKGTFDFPKTPKLKASLKTKDGIPSVVIAPDQVDKVAKVDVYYSIDNHILTRFWRSAPSERNGKKWQAKLPVMSTDQYLFVMANVYYKYDHKVVGYRWSSKQPETFGLSADMLIFTPEELKSAGVKAESKREQVIEKNFDDYQDWYHLDWGNPVWWSAYTRKIKDPMYQGPDDANLLIDVKADHDLTMFYEIQVNNWGAYKGQKGGQYYAQLDVKGGDWQTIAVSLSDFKPMNDRTEPDLKSWRYITELGIRGRVNVKTGGKELSLPECDHNNPNARWELPREMRNLRWSK